MSIETAPTTATSQASPEGNAPHDDLETQIKLQEATARVLNENTMASTNMPQDRIDRIVAQNPDVISSVGQNVAEAPELVEAAPVVADVVAPVIVEAAPAVAEVEPVVAEHDDVAEPDLVEELDAAHQQAATEEHTHAAEIYALNEKQKRQEHQNVDYAAEQGGWEQDRLEKAHANIDAIYAAKQ